jgi:hypothetical protein
VESRFRGVIVARSRPAGHRLPAANNCGLALESRTSVPI